MGTADAKFQGLRLAITYTYLWTCTKKGQGMASGIAVKFDTLASYRKLVSVFLVAESQFGEIIKKRGTILNLHLIFHSLFLFAVITEHYFHLLTRSRKQTLPKSFWKACKVFHVTSAIYNIWVSISGGAVTKTTEWECVYIFFCHLYILLCSYMCLYAHIYIKQDWL